MQISMRKNKDEKNVGEDEEKKKTAQDKRVEREKNTAEWEKIWDSEMEQERMRAEAEEAHDEKWFIQKLNTASSSKIKTLQWGWQLRHVTTKQEMVPHLQERE